MLIFLIEGFDFSRILLILSYYLHTTLKEGINIFIGMKVW